MRKILYIMLVGMLLALVACGKEEGGAANTASTTEVYTSVQELLLTGEYQKAEARDALLREIIPVGDGEGTLHLGIKNK